MALLGERHPVLVVDLHEEDLPVDEAHPEEGAHPEEEARQEEALHGVHLPAVGRLAVEVPLVEARRGARPHGVDRLVEVREEEGPREALRVGDLQVEAHLVGVDREDADLQGVDLQALLVGVGLQDPPVEAHLVGVVPRAHLDVALQDHLGSLAHLAGAPLPHHRVDLAAHLALLR